MEEYNKKLISDAVFLLKDLLYGDTTIDEREDWKKLPIDILTRARKVLVDNPLLSEQEKNYYINNLWRINYRGEKRPPSIDEFLTEEYLGDTAKSLFPYIRQHLIDFFDPQKQYRDAILYSFIGAGKSFFAVLATLFVTTHLILMKNPKRFFGLSPATILTQAYFSFTLDKAKELLLKPTQQILETSPKFKRCKTLEQLQRESIMYGTEKFLWSTADATAALTFTNGANIKIGSNPKNLLGNQVLTGVMSELAFCSDFGISEDTAIRMLHDLKGRMNSRFKGHYFSRSIIDSSPNTMESKIDKYINEIAPFEPRKPLIFKGAEWDWKTWDYDHIDSSFPVFLGNSSGPPKILKEEEVSKYDTTEIIYVPNDPGLYSEFKNDTIKALKDKAGIPAGSQDKLIQNIDALEAIFEEGLLNFYSCNFADAKLQPELLLWSQVASKFFIKIGKGYEFWRYPNAPRYISIDQSINGDFTGIVCLHRELDLEGKIVYVIDFSLTIAPNKGKINLEAIKFLIHDLRRLGRMNIKGVSFDQFQSESTIQYLEREGFNVKKISVDRTTSSYLNLINLINTGRLKSGKNLFIKNNLKSLIMSKQKNSGKPKVDHILGDVSTNYSDLNWETSELGYKQKDTTDPIAAAITLCDEEEKFTPKFIYNIQKDGIPEVEDRLGYTKREEIIFN